MPIKETSYIYFMFDINSMKGYVGKSLHPQERIRAHWNCRFKVNYYLHRWLRKLFSPPPSKILKECTGTAWKNWERYWITELRKEGWTLVNITDGGEGVEGLQHSEKSKREISRLSRKYWNSPRSDESRKILSKVNKGNDHALGYKHTAEARRKMSKAKKGVGLSEDHKKNIALAVSGHSRKH